MCYPDQSSLRERERVYVSSPFKVLSITVGKSSQLRNETAGHTKATVRKQKDECRNASFLIPFLHLDSLVAHPGTAKERCHLQWGTQCTKSRQSLRGVPWRPAPEMILGSVRLTVNTSQSPLHLCFLMRRPAFLTQPSNWKPLESTSLEWYTAFSLCSSPQLKTAESVIRSGEKRNNNAPQVNKSSFLQGGMEQWFFIC